MTNFHKSFAKKLKPKQYEVIYKNKQTMNIQLKNNYSQNMDLSLQLAMNSGFLGLNELYKLSNVDKFMNSLCKNLIEKYYDVLRKCASTPFTREISDIANYSIGFSSALIFKFNNNWDNVFGKKLNRDEMALYYSYFVFRFHNFCKTDNYSKHWMCILDEYGFVKSFSNDYHYGIEVADKDIVLKIQIHYSYIIYRNYPKKLNYWGTIIRFQQKDKDIVVYPNYIRTTDKTKAPHFNPECVNLRLLDNLITSEKYQSIFSKQFL